MKVSAVAARDQMTSPVLPIVNMNYLYSSLMSSNSSVHSSIFNCILIHDSQSYAKQGRFNRAGARLQLPPSSWGAISPLNFSASHTPDSVSSCISKAE